jgi:uncharacterized membrane protein
MDLDTMDSHFQEIEEVENIPVDRQVLHLLAKHGALNAQELKLAYQKSSLYPKREEWLYLAYRFFMAAGILLVMSGILFFFAYNWGGLHKFAKLGLVQGGIILIAAGLLFFKPSDFVLKLGLTAISVLIGIFLAVYGQIYQTGADAYNLFLGWTLFVTAWVAIAGFPFLWLFYLLLINTTVLLYLDQMVGYWKGDAVFLIVSVLNLVALVIWEYVIKGNRSDWVHALSTRLIGFVVLSALTTAIFVAIFDFRSSNFSGLHIVLYIGCIIGGGIYYSQKVKDVAFVAMIAISILLVVNALLIRIMVNGNDFGGVFFILSMLNIGATIYLVYALISLNKKWNLELINSEIIENDE